MQPGNEPPDAVQVGIRTALWIVLRAPDSYGLVLGLLLLSFILEPLVRGVETMWVRVLVQGATMMFALHTSRVHRRPLRIAGILFGVSFVIALAAALSGGGSASVGIINLLLALLLAVATPAMLRHILSAEEVTAEIVIGALDVYIILGLFFSAVYSAIGAFAPTPFFTGQPHPSSGSYQFFSFTTMTTVGYGNLVPAAQLGQSLAILEALLGQVYLVTLVARLVSAFQPGNRRHALERLERERLAAEKMAAGDPAGAITPGHAPESPDGG